MPLQEKEESRSEDRSMTLLLGGKEFLQQLNEEEVSCAIICNTKIENTK